MSDSYTTPDLPIFENNKIVSKQSAVAQKSEEKRTTISSPKSSFIDRARIQKELNMGTPVSSVEAYAQAFPESTPEQLQAYVQQKQAYDTAEQRKAADRSRTLSEVVSDLDAAVGVGFAQVGQTLETAATLGSRIAEWIDPESFQHKETAVAKFLAEKIDREKAKASAPLQESRLQQQEALQAFKAEAPVRQQEYVDRYGDSSIGSFFGDVEEFFREAGLGATSLLSDPKLLMDTVAQQIPNLLTGSAIAGGARVAASKIGQQGTKAVTDPKVAKALDDIGIKANVVYSGISEGNEVAKEIEASIKKADPKELAKQYPEFASLVSEYGEKRALELWANQAFLVGLGVQGVIASTVGKLTGSAKGDLDIAKGKTTGLVGSAVREGVEESVQEGTGQLTQNVLTQEYVDPTQATLEDVGYSAGTGLVSGPVTQAATQVGVGTAATVLNSSEVVDSVKESFESLYKDYKDSKRFSEIVGNAKKGKTDISPEERDSVIADVLVDKEFKDEVEKDLAASLNNYATARSVASRLATSKNRKERAQARVLQQEVLQKNAAIREALQGLDNPKLFAGIASIAPDVLTAEQVKAVKESDAPQEIKDLLGNTEKLAELTTTLDSVNSEIINGSTENKGIKTYLDEVREFVGSNQVDKANKSIAGLENFLALQQAKKVDLERIVELSANKQRSQEETQELSSLMDKRGLSFTGGIQKKLLPTVETEIQALEAAVSVAQGIINTAPLAQEAKQILAEIPVGQVTPEPTQTTETTSETVEAQPVAAATEASAETVVEDLTAESVKNSYLVLPTRAKEVLREALPRYADALESMKKDGTVSKTALQKLSQAVERASQATDIKALQENVKAATDAKNLLNSTKGFGLKAQQEVVDRIIGHPSLEGVKVKIQSLKDTGFLGGYSVENKTIYIDSDLLESNNQEDFDKIMETVIHEAVHPVTELVLDPVRSEKAGLSSAHKRLTKEIDFIQSVVGKYVEKNKSNLAKSNPNGLAAFEYVKNNPKEFPTKVLTDPAFQKLLKEVKYTGKSVFSKFVEVIAKALKLPTDRVSFLEKSIDVSDQIIAATEGYSLNNVIQENGLEDGKFSSKFRIKKNNLTKTIDSLGTIDTTNFSEKELRQYNRLLDLRKDFKNSLVTKVLNVEPKQYRQEKNLFSLLLHKGIEDGSIPRENILEDNVVNALFLSAMDWMSTSAGSTLANYKREIQQILGKDESYEPTPEEYAELSTIGRDTLIEAESIGSSFVNFLGVKELDAAHPYDKAKLITAAGITAISTLESLGLVSQSSRSIEEDGKTSSKRFVKALASESNPNELEASVREDVIDVYRNNEKVIESLVELPVQNNKPLLKPSKKAPEFTNRGLAKIPEFFKKAVLKQQEQPWFINTKALGVFEELPESLQLKIAGQINIGGVPSYKQESIKAKNGAIARSIREFTEHLLGLESTASTPFYFTYSLWTQGRFGMNKHGINPQANKFQRAMVHMGSHKVTVDPADKAMMDKFWIALGSSVGIDKGGNENIIKKTKEKFGHPVIQDAVESLNRLASNYDLTEDQRNKAISRVEAAIDYLADSNGIYSEFSPHAFEGLIEYSKMSTTEPFETVIAKEMDGITNGPIIALMQYMYDSSKETLAKLRKGGIFSNDDSELDYGKLVADGKITDLYNSLVAIWNNELQKTNDPIYLGLTNLLGQLKRQEGKDPLVKILYGAGFSTLATEFGENRLEAILSKAIQLGIEDQTNGTATHSSFIDEVNNLFGLKGKAAIRANQENPRGIVVPTIAQKAIISTVSRVYKEPLENALKDVVGSGIEGNLVAIETTQIANGIFRGIYEVEVDKLKANGNYNVASDKALKARLIELYPGIQGAFSKSKEEGVLISASTKTENEEALVKVAFNGSNSLGRKSFSAYSNQVRTFTDTGVTPASQYVQHIDAASMANIYNTMPVFGIHDAIIVGLDQEEKASVAMNKGLFDITNDFSILQESFNSLVKAISALNSLTAEEQKKVFSYKSKAPKDQSLGEILVKLAKKHGANNPQELVSYYNEMVTTSLKNREITLPQITHVNQYENYGFGYNPKEDTESTSVVEQAQKAIRSLDQNTDEFLGNPQNASAVFDVNKDNVVEVFDQLNQFNHIQEDAGHRETLRELVSDIAGKVVQPLNLAINNTYGQAQSFREGSDIFIESNTLSLPASSIKRTAEELYAYELTFNVIKEGLHTDSTNKKELLRLFRAAEKEITPEVFMDNPSAGKQSAEYKEAVKIYDEIFANLNSEKVEFIDKSTGIKTVHERNDFLAHFLATGLTNKKFKDALGKVDISFGSKEKVSLLERLAALFNTLVNAVQGKFTGVSGSIDNRMLVLAKRLSGVTYRQEGLVGVVQTKIEAVQEKVVHQLGDLVLKPLTKLVQSSIVQKNRSKLISSIGLLAQSAPAVKYKDFARVMRNVRRRTALLQDGFAAELITELKGTTENNVRFHNLLRLKKKVIDNTRLKVMRSTQQFLINAHQSDLTEDQKVAYSKVAIKGDLAYLYDGKYTVAELEKLMRDPKFLGQEIQKQLTKLNGYGEASNVYKKATMDLGWFMVTGMFKEELGAMNAYNIANLFNTGLTPSWDTTVVEDVIDTAASLIALSHMEEVHLQNMADVIRNESVFGSENGFTTTMNMLVDFKKQSDELLFAGSKALKIKNYAKEIYNPNISFEFATLDVLEELTKRNFKPAFKVGKDPMDPNQRDRYLWVSRYGLQGRYNAGVLSTTGKASRGTSTSDVYRDQGIYNTSTVTDELLEGVYARKEAAIRKMRLTANTAKDGAKLIPILNPNGDVVEYRYMMSEQNKDEVMERNNDFSEIIGHMQGSLIDKVETNRVNNLLLDTINADIMASYTSEPEAFRYIGSDAADEESRMIWNSMPSDTKEYAKELFGTLYAQDRGQYTQAGGFYIKKEHVKLVFGSRDPSVANLEYKPVPKDAGFKTSLAMLNNTMTYLLNRGTVKRVEDIWKEVVGMAKDAIVVKLGSVTAMNVLSNVVLLRMSGVSLSKAIQGQAEAYVGTLKYIKESEELHNLEMELAYGKSGRSKKRIQVEIARIKDSLASNPVKELVDAGVFQNIVEDVNMEDDQYSYRGAIKEALGNRVGKLLPDSKAAKLSSTVLKNLFMAHDTAIYKFLQDAAHISDFAARYTLHKYNVQEKGMSKEDSIADVVETFVNYDLPTHTSIQYANEMGLVMFSKYTIRTQKAILKLLKNNPKDVVGMLVLQSLVGDVPDIVGDSNAFAADWAYKFNTSPGELIGLATEIVDIPTINLMIKQEL